MNKHFKTFVSNLCRIILQEIKNLLHGREKNRLERPEQIIIVVYFHVMLFKMHEIDTIQRKILTLYYR